MMVHNLRESRNKAVVVFTKFTRLYKQHPLALYCFFEGEDSKYYGIRIEHIARPDKPIFFDCDGKEGVVGIYTMLKNRKHYSSVQAAYFIDRDFDISVYETSLTGIYETPCYSIENFYTSIDCFSKILRSEFKLGESDQDFENCISLYTKLQNQFHDAMEQLNVWLACQKDKAVELNISSLRISDFVRISLETVASTYTSADLRTRFPNSQLMEQQDLDLKRADLLTRSPQKSFRGKFEIEFLITFLTKLSDVANQGNYPYFTKKVKVTLNVSRKTVISILSQYADTPDCLYRYLESFRRSVS